MNSGAAFSQIRRVIDLERRCFFSARWRGDSYFSYLMLGDMFERKLSKMAGGAESAKISRCALSCVC